MHHVKYVNEYLKEKFGEHTLKICIDGDYTCPNRDGTLSKEGCIYCSNRGSGEHLKKSITIEKQIKNYFSSYKAERANSFIIYFQNYTNTYDTIENLKIKYDTAINAFNTYKLPNKKLVGLQIATRPDCINEDIAKLIEKYKDKLYVAVELGFQTSNEETKSFNNTCYTNDDFSNAVKILNKYSIDVITHIMVGLPTNTKLGRETHEDIASTIDFLNTQNIQGLKIHSVYVVKSTQLEKLYNQKKYVPLTINEYLDELYYILTHINQEIIIHRISGDAPKDLLVAPEWNSHKKLILNGIYKKMNEQ